MKSFKKSHHVDIPGRGLVIVVKIPNPKKERVSSDMPKKNEVVLIDGDKYRVRFVESQLILTDPPYWGEEVGFGVEME